MKPSMRPRTKSSSTSRYVTRQRNTSSILYLLSPESDFSTKDARVRALGKLMALLVVINIIPMLYILSSDPNKWVQVRRIPQQPQTSLITKAPKVENTPSLVLKPKLPGVKLILFLNFPKYYQLDEATGPQGLSKCNTRSPFKEPIKCELTTDVKLFNQSDAVVFYSHGLDSMADFAFTPRKLRGQTWTFFAVESPEYSHNWAFGAPQFTNMFNSSMTYRTDSEFFHGYLRAERKRHPMNEEEKSQQELELRAAFRKKTRMAAIFTSHCDTQSERGKYINQLKRYMDIDVIGSCGHLKCGDRAQCNQMLADDYKFYLAFENALCVDYVTEKALIPMNSMRVVTVVRGGADYSNLLPPNSVIDSSHFFSSYDLAHHLNAVAQDEDEWVRMFEWSWNWRVFSPSLPLCPYCYHLVRRSRPMHHYHNIHSWWSTRTCFPPNDL